MISLIRANFVFGGLLIIPLLSSVSVSAQTPPPARPAQPVQPDLSGDWSIKIHEDDRYRNPGAELGEYEGIPLSPAGRLKASSWNAALNTLPERQCLPLPADDFTDFGNMRIWKEVDPATRQVIAWHEYTEWGGQERTIWMDGRPHPSEYAPHTWQGFSTGEWERNQLTITTTHLKMGVFERIGVYRSDVGTLREHWVRHGDYLTITLIISDPVYLEAPFVRSRDYLLNLNPQPHAWSCTPTAEIANRPDGYVPHYLPGKNPFLQNAVTRFGIPESAVGGGAETMYPEFQLKLKNPSATVAVRPRLAQEAKVSSPEQPGLEKVTITTLPVQGNVYVLAAATGNTTVQVGEYSVLVVDTQLAPLSPKILAAIRQISNKPIRYVVNTSADANHTGGNEEISKAGNSVSGQAFLGEQNSAAAAIIAHENVLQRMSAPTGAKAPVPFAAWPTETYATKEYQLFNGEGIEIIHEPAAHTDGDSIVFFRRSDVISTGEIFSMTGYPVINRQNGGSIQGILAALNHILRMAIPRFEVEGGTYIIPSRGRICDQSEVMEYRDMVTIIRDRIQDLIDSGKTLEQIKAAQPSLDYDARFGAPDGSWTKDMFIEAVYTDLKQAKKN
jgi:cyclase